jgi:hypothetical protein
MLNVIDIFLILIYIFYKKILLSRDLGRMWKWRCVPRQEREKGLGSNPCPSWPICVLHAFRSRAVCCRRHGTAHTHTNLKVTSHYSLPSASGRWPQNSTASASFRTTYVGLPLFSATPGNLSAVVKHAITDYWVMRRALKEKGICLIDRSIVVHAYSRDAAVRMYCSWRNLWCKSLV